MEARILPARDETWRDVVLRNVRHGRLVMTFANEGYALFLHNWVESLRALRLDEFVVVALDPPIAAQLARRGLARHTIDGGAQTRREARAVRPAGRLKAVSWYDPAYRQLMGSQPSRVLRVMEAGAFDLLVTDVDVLWRASPWPVLLSPARRRCEVQAIQAHAAREGVRNASEQPVVVREPHPQANCASCINAGFLFLRRGSPSALELVRRWERALQAVNNVDHNQKWLNWVLSSWDKPTNTRKFRGSASSADRTQDAVPPPRVCHLPSEQFLNGRSVQALPLAPPPLCACSRAGDRGGHACAARLRRSVSDVRVAHVNFALSLSHKVCLAKGLGLWLISDSEAHRASFELARGSFVSSHGLLNLSEPDANEGEVVPTKRAPSFRSATTRRGRTP